MKAMTCFYYEAISLWWTGHMPRVHPAYCSLTAFYLKLCRATAPAEQVEVNYSNGLEKQIVFW